MGDMMDVPAHGDLPSTFAVLLYWDLRPFDGIIHTYFIGGNYVTMTIPSSMFSRFGIESFPCNDVYSPEQLRVSAYIDKRAVEISQEGLTKIIPGQTGNIRYDPKTDRWLTSKSRFIPPKLSDVPLWRPLIPYSEIKVWHHGHMSGMEIYGYWGEKPVDVWIAYDHHTTIYVEDSIRGRYELHKLGLESQFGFPQIGFLADEFNNIIGVVTEGAKGRRPERRDVSLLFNTCSTMLNLGFSYTDWDVGTLITDSGEVKFRSPYPFKATNPLADDFEVDRNAAFETLQRYVQADVLKNDPLWCMKVDQFEPRSFKDKWRIFPICVTIPSSIAFTARDMMLAILPRFFPDFQMKDQDTLSKMNGEKEVSKRKCRKKKLVTVDTSEQVSNNLRGYRRAQAQPYTKPTREKPLLLLSE